MDTRRLLIAALLSLAVMMVWGYLFPPPETPAPSAPGAPEVAERGVAGEQPTPPPEPSPGTAQTTGADGAPMPKEAEPPVEADSMLEGVGVEQPAEEPISASAEESVVLSGDGYRAEFTNRGGQLLSFQLSEHRNARGAPVDLVRERAEGPYLFGFAGPEGAASALNDVLYTVEREPTDSGGQAVVFRYRGPEGRAEKRFAFEPNGLLDVEVTARTPAGWTLVLGPGIRNPNTAELDNRFTRRSASYRLAEGVESIDPARIKEIQAVAAIGLRWVALQDTYFLTAAVPQAGLQGVLLQPAVVLPGVDDESGRFRPFRNVEDLSEEEADLEREIYLLLQPQAERIELVSFLGAKEYDRLKALPYGLEETVQLGWFKFLSLPLLYGLRWIHDKIVANYGWAIILMTVLIRLVLFPLTHKSTVSMQKMQEVNPKVQAIRQKYRSKLKDKQGRPNAEMQRKMNEEVMALYKSEGVNPAGGCLPMLLQIPVLFAFYNILSTAIEIRNAPWILWITDLSAKDPFYVLPIVMGGTQFLQQRMTPAAGDPMQRRMFALMPIFFTILFLGFPSGLVLYWLTNNVLGIGQQYMYKRLRESKAEGGPEAGGTSRDRSKRGAK